jgi:hypothetical protein
LTTAKASHSALRAECVHNQVALMAKRASRQAMTSNPTSRRGQAKMDTPEVIIEAQVVEVIARRVVELLQAEVQPTLVDAATLARDLGVERDWVYSHAKDLGAIRLGGSHGRLRFDRKIARERLEIDEEPVRSGRRRRTPTRAAKHGGPRGLPQGTQVKSSQTQRRASGTTPARSPRPQQRGGSPNAEA